MTCGTAMVTNVISASPDQTIGDALALLDKHGIRAVPIVGGEGQLLGVFTFDVVLSNLLPDPMRGDRLATAFESFLDRSLRLDYLPDAERDVAKHFRDLLPARLADVMDRDVVVAHPDTPLWEGIRLLVQHGSPLPVVEEGTKTLRGLLSVQSVVAALSRARGVNR